MKVKVMSICLLILAVFMSVACGSTTETIDEDPQRPDSVDSDTQQDGGGVFPRSTPTTAPSDAGSEAGAPTILLPSEGEAANEAGYPSREEAVVRDPYPAPTEAGVWLMKPVGVQCEEGEAMDLTDVVAELEEAGIVVKESEMMEMMVCAACGCPTSEHYRVRIADEDLKSAVELGWTEDGV